MTEIELEERKDIELMGKSSHAMALNEKLGKMIVARKIEGCDDVLEQFNILPGWMTVREKLICPANGSIESVCFVGDSILSTHINGSVVISSPHSDAIRRVQVCPAPLWSCCAVSPNQAALVSHSAILYYFNLEEAAVEKSVSLGVDSRLFAVGAKNGQVAVGGQNIVFIIKDGQIKHSLAVARHDKRLPTIVWTVAFMRDNLVVSGDSRGKLCFWNSESGALLQELDSHQADILTICPVGENICAAGVDPRIMTIREVNPNTFHVISKRNGPTRDVKALAACDERVYAVGDDHEIYVGYQGCQVVRQQLNKQVILGGRLAMIRGLNYVDLHTCGEGEEETEGKITVAKMPVFLARIFTPGKLPLTACDISADGGTIALSTPSSTTLYRIHNKKKKQAIARIPGEGKPATAVKILKKSVLLAGQHFELTRWPLEEGAEATQIMEQAGCGLVTQLAVSQCERYAAVVTSRLEIYVIDLKQGESRPLRVDLPIDMAFTDADSLLILTAAAGFEIPDKTKKILYEFPATGGAVLRSISAANLYNSPNIRAVSISAGQDNRLLVLGQEGQMAVINKERDHVDSLDSYQPISSAVQHFSCQFRSANRLFVCSLQQPAPEAAPFKLKKFQTQ